LDPALDPDTTTALDALLHPAITTTQSSPFNPQDPKSISLSVVPHPNREPAMPFQTRKLFNLQTQTQNPASPPLLCSKSSITGQ
jgi:hypothetical protein